jgi:hypothetical protein
MFKSRTSGLTTLKVARRAAKTNEDIVRKAWKLDSWAKIVELAGLSRTTLKEDCRHLNCRIQAMFRQNIDAGIEHVLRGYEEARKGRKASRSRRVQGSVISATNHWMVCISDISMSEYNYNSKLRAHFYN